MTTALFFVVIENNHKALGLSPLKDLARPLKTAFLRRKLWGAHVKESRLLVDDAAARDRILSFLDEESPTFVSDTLLLVLSGHGTDSGEFLSWFAPAGLGVSASHLAESLLTISASKNTIAVLDFCHADQVVQALNDSKRVENARPKLCVVATRGNTNGSSGLTYAVVDALRPRLHTGTTSPLEFFTRVDELASELRGCSLVWFGNIDSFGRKLLTAYPLLLQRLLGAIAPSLRKITATAGCIVAALTIGLAVHNPSVDYRPPTASSASCTTFDGANCNNGVCVVPIRHWIRSSPGISCTASGSGNFKITHSATSEALDCLDPRKPCLFSFR